VSAIGKPAYSAPEQRVRGQQITPRADIYSMGVILRQTLTGKLPARDGVTTQLRKASPLVSQTEPIAQPGYQELDELLEQMTAQEASDRPDIEAVWERLEELTKLLKDTALA
jgi:eukaryotic-like serine/threonine-protein kinase